MNTEKGKDQVDVLGEVMEIGEHQRRNVSSGEVVGQGVPPGADVLEEACAGRWPQVEELLDRGVDINTKTVADKLSLLHQCAVTGSPRAAQMLLGRGADLHVRDEQGRTAAMLARQVGNHPVAELLIAHGCKQE